MEIPVPFRRRLDLKTESRVVRWTNLTFFFKSKYQKQANKSVGPFDIGSMKRQHKVKTQKKTCNGLIRQLLYSMFSLHGEGVDAEV